MPNQSAQARQAKRESDVELELERWIVNSFCTYPIMSRSLISQTLQGCHYSEGWRQVLHVLVDKGIIRRFYKETVTLTGRNQNLELYKLGPFARTFIIEHLPHVDVDRVMKDPYAAVVGDEDNIPEPETDEEAAEAISQAVNDALKN